ncbi:DNA-processing protein DprA [Pedobacter sp. MC2016-14]|uniref:DNA-processing protein DprA n=1 Tax=Pedobacter sp. MC2016-14 TaxID=2897327 RepID=UPI001E5CD353|nr:DNA-processing protein DprA [Pedobacter sp. MC2016-14]MCD0489414.1 DNA-processing protein DprA [Pedobacter sp. MC2016-14]
MSIIHKVALSFIEGIGHVHAGNLLTYFGSAEAVFKASKKELLAIDGIGAARVQHILNTNALKLAEQQLKIIERQKIEILFYSDDNYPRRLRQCADAPIVLYYKGTADLNHPRMVSVVGTRKATDYGRRLCEQLAAELMRYDVVLVSGLAFGIDVAAHQECLKRGVSTIGVLGHGLDRIYPSLHTNIAQQMAQNGGLLTEFPFGTNPDKENFPKRNRIIAGMTDATIVVEATAKGGALITADIANSYSRDVYAFPGRTTDQYSEGCNHLIKNNSAALINHSKDLIHYMGWNDVKLPQFAVQRNLDVNLIDEEKQIIDLLRRSPALIDEISAATSIPQSKLAIHLLNLEIQGLLTVLPGKIYNLI